MLRITFAIDEEEHIQLKLMAHRQQKTMDKLICETLIRILDEEETTFNRAIL